MAVTVSDNRRIAKNTFVLYIRMAVVLIISLYTSRVVLKALGVDDFGLFGVIGGLIGLFAFMQSSLSKAKKELFILESTERIKTI